MEIWQNCKKHKSKNYVVITMDFHKDAYKAYHCKTLRESKIIFESLVNSKYSGEIVVDYIRIVNKKTGKVIEED